MSARPSSAPTPSRRTTRDRRADYVRLVCEQALPAAAKAGLADAVDAFCEGIAFSVAETEEVFRAAKAHGLPVKLHAEQLSNLGGAELAARYGALSVDHIEYLDEEGVDAIAAAGTVAVLLPGAFYYLREKQAPPVAALRSKNVPISIATDLNPGSSPVHSLLATMNMACVLFGLTPEEALLGVTANAARALGLADRGRIAPGLKADLVLWDVERPGELAYPLGFNPLAAVIRNGEARPGIARMSDVLHFTSRSRTHILAQIRSGAWAPGARVPSENELVESFGISRMTANRALRELFAEGYVDARAGRRHLRARSRPPAPACWNCATSPRRSPSAAIATPPASPRERRLQPIRHWPRSSRPATCTASSTSRWCTRRTACPFSSRTVT